MGKRSAAGELFLGNMGSIQRETRPSIQREDQLTMETKLEQIAAKARREPKLRFTSLAHLITRDRVQKNLLQIPKWSAAGVDGQTVEAAKKSFDGWIEPMLQSIHRQGYRAPDIRRVYIHKPGKTEKRPLGVAILDASLTVDHHQFFHRNRLNEKYPEITAAFRQQGINSFIADGEIVAFKDELASF